MDPHWFQCGSGSRLWWPKTFKFYSWKLRFFRCRGSKLQENLSAIKREHPQHFKTWRFTFTFFCFCESFLPSWIWIQPTKNQRASTAVICAVDMDWFIPNTDPTLQLTGLGIAKFISNPDPDETSPRSSGSKCIWIYDTERIIYRPKEVNTWGQISSYLKTAFYEFNTLQGGSDKSGTISILHRRVKKKSFSIILFGKTVSAVSRNIIINKQSHSSEDESPGELRSQETLRTLRRIHIPCSD